MINLIFGMAAATLFVHNVSIFRSFRKMILWVIKKWSSEAALNFEFFLSDWHISRLTQFTVVLINSSNTASNGDYTPPILLSGRSTPAFKDMYQYCVGHVCSSLCLLAVSTLTLFLFKVKG